MKGFKETLLEGTVQNLTMVQQETLENIIFDDHGVTSIEDEEYQEVKGYFHGIKPFANFASHGRWSRMIWTNKSIPYFGTKLQGHIYWDFSDPTSHSAGEDLIYVSAKTYKSEDEAHKAVKAALRVAGLR